MEYELLLTAALNLIIIPSLVHQVQSTSIYTGCSDLNQCFGLKHPLVSTLGEGCMSKQDCTMVASLTFSDEKVDVELRTNQLEESKYVAVAFSDDQKMGEDLVFVCSPSWIPEHKIKVFWNAKDDKNSSPLKDHDGVPKDQSVTEKDGHFTCKFSLEKHITVKAENENKEYHFEEGHYILLASGPAEATGIKKHDQGRGPSDKKFGKKGETSVTKPEEDAEGQSTATGIATDVIVNPLAVVLTIIPFLFNV